MARQVIGPDVSFYQDDPGTPQEINFVRMNQTADFVIIRAGQNLWIDSDFINNWRRSREAGLPRGSYWFFDSRADPRQQAELWVNVLGNDLGELPLFLDLEEAYRGPFTGWRHWKTFLQRLRALLGSKEIGIYTAFHYWNSNAPINQPGELEYFDGFPLWIANYGVSVPLVPQPWEPSEWLFWQFTASGDGPFYGVESLEIDLNYFNGDPVAFARRFNVPVPEDPIPPEPGERYRVTAGTLNVRAGPGTNFEAIGFLRRNEIVEALEANADGTWLRVRRLSDGLTGWASSAYLIRITPPPPPPPPPVGERYRVTANTLYVREGPGTNFPSLGFLRRDDIVEALEFNADRSWIRVRRLTDNLTGWSSATYLELVDDTPPPPPPTGDQYRVTANTLYVREGPGTNSPSVGFLRRDDIVEALEFNADRSWIRVRRLTDNLTGWSSATYLERIDDTTPPPTEDRYRVTATRLHVREGPATEFRSLGYVELNEVVTAIDANDDESWRQIRRSDGLAGWSFARYLTRVEDRPPPDPNEPPPDDVTGNWYRLTGRINARQGPGTNFAAVGSLNKDEIVQALSANDDQSWIRFTRVDGFTAWASNTYLNKVGKNPGSIMQKVFKGVTYYRNERTSPRRLIWHVLEIDTRTTEGLRFLVTPPDRETVPQLCSRTVAQFLDEHDMQIAVNADGFHYHDPDEYPPQQLCPGGGDPVRPLGYAASRGKVYSQAEPGAPIVYINQNNQISIDKPKGKIYNAFAADVILVQKGKKVSGLDKRLLNPRTAFGMSQNGRWLYLMVVDGREFASQGVSFDELADMLIQSGAYVGVALDGGGSSTMVIEGVDRRPRVLNTPVNENKIGKERAVANHLGISLKKQ